MHKRISSKKASSFCTKPSIFDSNSKRVSMTFGYDWIVQHVLILQTDFVQPDKDKSLNISSRLVSAFKAAIENTSKSLIVLPLKPLDDIIYEISRMVSPHLRVLSNHEFIPTWLMPIEFWTSLSGPGTRQHQETKVKIEEYVRKNYKSLICPSFLLKKKRTTKRKEKRHSNQRKRIPAKTQVPCSLICSH